MAKRIKTFDCPSCGNELPCNDNRIIRCIWCKRLIVPRGYASRQAEAVVDLSEVNNSAEISTGKKE